MTNSKTIAPNLAVYKLLGPEIESDGHDIQVARVTEMYEWMKTLPADVVRNTEITDALKSSLTENSPQKTAQNLALAIQHRSWEGLALDAFYQTRRVVHMDPMSWMREVLKTEPDVLMQIVASPLPDPKVGAEAAIVLVDVVKAAEPDTFRRCLQDYDNGGSVLPGWKTLLEGNAKTLCGPWTEAAAELDKAAKQKHGGDRTEQSTGPVPCSTRVSEGTRTALRRRLEASIEKAQQAGDTKTVKQLTHALETMLRLGTQVTRAQLMRLAGWGEKRVDGSPRLRLSENHLDNAHRVIKALGPDGAAQLAAAITQILTGGSTDD